MISLIIIVVIIGGTMWFLSSPLFPAVDSLISELIRNSEDGTSLDFLDSGETNPAFQDSDIISDEQADQSAAIEIYGPDQIPLGEFISTELGISFLYPMDWEIEKEADAVTFYHPQDVVFIYLGEFSTDPGDTARSIAMDFLDSVQEDAQADSFALIRASDYSLNMAQDAYLVLFEWIDEEGDYAWAYDLEVVSGESNLFIFFYGAEKDTMVYYGELFDVIASSMAYIEY